MPLFPGLDGDYSRTDAAVHIRQDPRAAGLPDKVDGRNVDFHATRRSCATWLEELGGSDVHRKRLMGHAIKDRHRQELHAQDASAHGSTARDR